MCTCVSQPAKPVCQSMFQMGMFAWGRSSIVQETIVNLVCLLGWQTADCGSCGLGTGQEDRVPWTASQRSQAYQFIFDPSWNVYQRLGRSQPLTCPLSRLQADASLAGLFGGKFPHDDAAMCGALGAPLQRKLEVRASLPFSFFLSAALFPFTFSPSSGCALAWW